MTDLDTLLRQAEKNGLTALTVWPCGEGWQCNARYARKGGKQGWVCVTDSDPVRGARKALSGTSSPTPEPAPTEDVFG